MAERYKRCIHRAIETLLEYYITRSLPEALYIRYSWHPTQGADVLLRRRRQGHGCLGEHEISDRAPSNLAQAWLELNVCDLQSARCGAADIDLDLLDDQPTAIRALLRMSRSTPKTVSKVPPTLLRSNALPITPATTGSVVSTPAQTANRERHVMARDSVALDSGCVSQSIGEGSLRITSHRSTELLKYSAILLRTWTS